MTGTFLILMLFTRHVPPATQAAACRQQALPAAKTTRTWLPPVMTTVLPLYLAPPAGWPVLYRGGALGALVVAAALGRTPCWRLHACGALHSCQRRKTPQARTSRLFLLQRSAKGPVGSRTPACEVLTDCLSGDPHRPHPFTGKTAGAPSTPLSSARFVYSHTMRPL